MILLIVPRVVEQFYDFDSSLPATTVFFLKTKIPMAAAMILISVVLLAKEIILRNHPKITHTINTVVIVITGVLIGAMAMAIGLPLRLLYQSVQ